MSTKSCEDLEAQLSTTSSMWHPLIARGAQNERSKRSSKELATVSALKKARFWVYPSDSNNPCMSTLKKARFWVFPSNSNNP